MKHYKLSGDVWRQIEELRAELTKAGTFTIDDIAHKLVLPTDPQYLAAVDNRERLRIVKEYDRAMRPQRLQKDLFAASAWIPLGKSERVRLGDATADQILTWGAIEAKTNAAASAAYATKAAFIAKMSEAFAKNRHITNAKDLWMVVFGWEERADPAPDVDEDGDDDDV